MSNIAQMAIDRPVETGGHAAALGTLAATIGGYLPVLLALVPALYYLLLIYESKTVQTWAAERKARKAARKLAYLKARQTLVEAELLAAETVSKAKAAASGVVEAAKADAVEVVDAAKDNYRAKCNRLREGSSEPCLLCPEECVG